jgi:hypothetical protein
VAQLVQLLSRLEDDHLDSGRRLHAAGVRSAIALLQQRGLQTHASKADGTSARR